MFVYLGESLKEHLTEVKPSLMSTIDKEFEKWANAKPSPPTRTVRPTAPRMVEVEEMEEIEVIDEDATPTNEQSLSTPDEVVAVEPEDVLPEKPAVPQEIVRE